MTAGIVSAKARSLGQNGKRPGGLNIESFIQTDAALNPGNSRSSCKPQRRTDRYQLSNIFQHRKLLRLLLRNPTTIVKKVIADIRQYGSVQRAVLGCQVIELMPNLPSEKGITIVKSGMLIASVNDMSTAKELGLKEDDVITAVNGVEVHNHAELVEQMNKFRPGDKITVTFVRDNKKMSKSGTLRNMQEPLPSRKG